MLSPYRILTQRLNNLQRLFAEAFSRQQDCRHGLIINTKFFPLRLNSVEHFDLQLCKLLVVVAGFEIALYKQVS